MSDAEAQAPSDHDDVPQADHNFPEGETPDPETLQGVQIAADDNVDLFDAVETGEADEVDPDEEFDIEPTGDDPEEGDDDA